MAVFTKLAVDIFAPEDGGGNARTVSNEECQVWGTEVEEQVEDALDLVDQFGLSKESVYKPGDDPIVIIATGQSNMLAVTQANGGDRTTEPGVFVWDQDFSGTHVKGWHEAGPDAADWPWRGGNTNGGIFYSFARRLRRETKRRVYVIMHAAGGQPIAEFIPGGTMWAGLIASIRDAAGSPELAFRATIPLADYLLFHQGEADADYTGTTGEQWLARFDAFITAMRTQQPTANNVWPIRAETKVIIGELYRGGVSGANPTDSRNVEINYFMNGRDPYIGVARSHTYRSTDQLHISSRDLDDFGGQRYYEATMRLPKPSPSQAIGILDFGNGIVQLTGSVTVNASSTVNVPLPVSMKDNTYMVTLTNTGGSAPVFTRISAYNLSSFDITTLTGGNQIFRWSVVGMKAAS